MSDVTRLCLPPKRAFSLTETLVVLAVLGILAALLFPVFASARRRAQDATCISNLQQLSHAMAMYTSDYDGAYPLSVEGIVYNHKVVENTRIWSDMLAPYLHGTLPACPTSDFQYVPANAGRTGYVLNARLNRQIGSRLQHSVQGRDETILQHPSCTVILTDARIGMIAASMPDMATTKEGLYTFFGHPIEDSSVEGYLDQEPGGVRHHGGASYAFGDGHVKWLLPQHLRTDRKSDGSTPGFGL